MDIKGSLIRQVNANVPKVWASPHFTGKQMWLTFYLNGLEEPLERISETLTAAGWLISGDAGGGLIYPVVQVEQTVDAVMEAALWLQSFCARHAIIDLIDADTIPMSNRSRIITLYSSEIENWTFSAR